MKQIRGFDSIILLSNRVLCVIKLGAPFYKQEDYGTFYDQICSKKSAAISMSFQRLEHRDYRKQLVKFRSPNYFKFKEIGWGHF